MRKHTRELLKGMQARLDAQEQLLQSQEERILAEQKRIDACEQGLAQLAENVRNHNQMLDGYMDLVTNVRNTNALTERISSQSEMFGIKIARKEVINEPELLKLLAEREDLKFITDIKPDADADFAKFEGRYFSTPKKMGAQTAEANINAGIAAAKQINAFFADGCTKYQVNK